MKSPGTNSSYFVKLIKKTQKKSSGPPGGGGQTGQFAPGPQLKGGGQNLQKGSPKGVIKKMIWNVFYISNCMREIF